LIQTVQTNVNKQLSVSMQPSGFPQVAFTAQQSLYPQSIQEQSLNQVSDLNSPEVFQQNVQLVQAHVGRLQSLARSAAAGMSGNNELVALVSARAD
jgi:hypothetical protein